MNRSDIYANYRLIAIMYGDGLKGEATQLLNVQKLVPDVAEIKSTLVPPATYIDDTYSIPTDMYILAERSSHSDPFIERYYIVPESTDMSGSEIRKALHEEYEYNTDIEMVTAWENR